MFCKDIEIPQIDVTLDKEFENCELLIVPERLKRRVKITKEYKLREKVGSVSIELNENPDGEDNLDEEVYDDFEQIYYQKSSQCKYKFMYGTQDIKDLNILQLVENKSSNNNNNNKTKRLIIEIPEFRNYLMYNLISEKLLKYIKPSKVYLFVEDSESTISKGNPTDKSKQMMQDFISGKYRGPGGELGFGGIIASFLNRFPLEESVFIVVDRSVDTMKTLYL